MDGHIGGGVDAQANLVTQDSDYRNHNILSNTDAFTDSTAQDQHDGSSRAA